MKPLAVVAGIVVQQGRVLIARRPMHKESGGLWEFPGGKIEQGETPQQALERELREEMDFSVRVGPIWDARIRSGEGDGVLILFYRCEAGCKEPKALEHSELKWVLPCEILDYDFPPADRAVAERIAREETL